MPRTPVMPIFRGFILWELTELNSTSRHKCEVEFSEDKWAVLDYLRLYTYYSRDNPIYKAAFTDTLLNWAFCVISFRDGYYVYKARFF